MKYCRHVPWALPNVGHGTSRRIKKGEQQTVFNSRTRIRSILPDKVMCRFSGKRQFHGHTQTRGQNVEK